MGRLITLTKLFALELHPGKSLALPEEKSPHGDSPVWESKEKDSRYPAVQILGEKFQCCFFFFYFPSLCLLLLISVRKMQPVWIVLPSPSVPRHFLSKSSHLQQGGLAGSSEASLLRLRGCKWDDNISGRYEELIKKRRASFHFLKSTIDVRAA